MLPDASAPEPTPTSMTTETALTHASSSAAIDPVTAPDEPPLAKRGRSIAKLLAERKFAEVVRDFDATMSQALPEAKLAQTWDGIEKSVGPFDSVSTATVVESGAYKTAIVTSRFGKTDLDLKIAFDRQEKISGFFVAPTPQPWAPPTYADLQKVEEREVIVNPGPWQVPGTLTLPKGSGPFRAVILVHGSGPGDRDQSVGPNRPFKDIALGLATKGVAVLRYEKRTREHGRKIDIQAFGVDDESVDDAIAAVALLSSDATIDPSKIYVLGHSLGGTFVPRIGDQTPKLAGIAIVAGATRSVPEMMIEQMEYIASLDQRKSSEEETQLDGVKAAHKRIRELQSGAKPNPAGEVVLGAGPKYWIEIAKLDPLATVKRLSMPVFVAQGGRDYQVTDVDYAAWQKALDGKPKITLKRYADLNHLMMAGSGKSTPEEYQVASHVDATFINDLTAWVLAD